MQGMLYGDLLALFCESHADVELSPIRDLGEVGLKALQAVVRVPKLFVGHVPLNFKEKELTQLFSSHGNVVKVTLLKGPEGKPRGCAMVQFTTWSEAEAAQSALHGSPPAKGLNGKPLVVQFAQPRRGNNGMLLEGAIAPRKLYVTKISHDATHNKLMELFAPYGAVEFINVVQGRDGGAGCAFVQYAKWSSAEAAINALHEQHIMPGCEQPMVVKFADAQRRRSELEGPGDTRPTAHPHQSGKHFGSNAGGGVLGLAPHAASSYVMPQFFQHPTYFPGMQAAYYMPPEMAGAYAAVGVPMGAPMLHPGQWPGQVGAGQAGGLGSGGHGSANSLAEQNRSESDASDGQQMPAGPVHGQSSLSPLLSLSLSGDSSSDSPSPALSQGVQPLPGQMPLSMQQAHHAASTGANNGQLMSPYVLSAADVAAMANMQVHGGVYASGKTSSAAAHPMQLMAIGLHPQFTAATGARRHVGKLGHGVSDPAVYAHKLFIGQIPYQASELDLWHLFAPHGDILELAVLRNAGVSRGCAFLTYSSRSQAETAMGALNGRAIMGKRMVVKFADHKASVPGGGALESSSGPQEADGDGNDD